MLSCRAGPGATAGVLMLLLAGASPAGEPAPGSLPEPLTLEAAVAGAAPAHPDLAAARARLAAAEAESRVAAAGDDLRASVEAGLRWIEPQRDAPEYQHDDHNLSLVVRKRLWDFGYTAARTAAEDLEARGSRAALLGVAQGRRVEIMARFFDVLLADLQYARDNEAMAVAFVDLDKRRDRHELGQVSDLLLLELESTYQRLRRQRAASAAAQRATRAALAEALGRPGELSRDLVIPVLPGNDRDLPEVTELQERALAGNPSLQALRAEAEAARQRVAAARRAHGPVIRGEVEAGAHTRRLGSRDRFMAGVVLDLPLYTGDRTDAAVARERALAAGIDARAAARASEIRQAVLELWLELQTLQVQREEMQVRSDFRDLDLDRSRALYEMEVRTDLGDAMVQTTAVRLERLRTELAMALAWARLDALMGVAPDTIGANALQGASR